ncbi:uncharacterized protein [Spinacia oleracea]|uniref:Uncharacterized protein isoform X2 n=1 Tax=Spinacia oleracea TaxID=3562 RepID=A0ABM3RMA2_SPIOL|nr:uncharacterized protein LOC110794155 isoform X2 [Spinacia oleracea]
METDVGDWPIRQRSNRSGYCERDQQKCLKIIEPNDHVWSTSFGSRFKQQVDDDNTEYPRTFHTKHSITWIRSVNARPRESYIEDYLEKDVNLGQPVSRSDFHQRRGHPNDPPCSSYHRTEDVVPDQPFSRSVFSERRSKYSDVLSYDYPDEDVVPAQPFSRPERRNRYSDCPSYDHLTDPVPVQQFLRSKFPERRSRYSDSPYDSPTKDMVPAQLFSRSDSPERSRYTYRPAYGRQTEDTVPDQPLSRSNFRERRRYSNNSPPRSRLRRDSSTYEDYNDEARPNFKRKRHEYRAKRWEDTEEHNRHGLNRSPNRQSIAASRRSFKSMTNFRKFDDQPRKQVRHTISSKSEVPSYRSKGFAPAPVSNSAKVFETKCSKGNGEVDSAIKSSKDNAEAKLKVKTESSKDIAGTILAKKLVRKSPNNDNAEANLGKKLATKSSKENADANLGKKIATKLSQENAEANVTEKLATESLNDDNAEASISKLATKSSEEKEEAILEKKLATKSSHENAEANFTKKLETKSCKDSEEASFTKRLETKSSESDHKEVEPENQDGVQHGSLLSDHKEVKREKKDGVQHGSSTLSDRKEVKLEKQDGVQHGSSSSNHKDSGMTKLKTKISSEKDASVCPVRLAKDCKLICFAKCTNPLIPPIQPSSSWNVDIVKSSSIKGLHELPRFPLFPFFKASNERSESYQKSEWIKFLTFLYKNDKVATVELPNLKVHVHPPKRDYSVTDGGLYFTHAVAAYELREVCDTSVDQRHAASDAYVKGSSSAEKGPCSSISKCNEAVHSRQPFSVKEDVSTERTFVRTDPSYLKTLGQAHSGWIFGAIAELVDNSRDARASRLEVAIETIFDKAVGSEIPMLSIIDDGVGMNHQDILRMISFGHKVPDDDNQDRVGRFGVGFKTGSMRLGRDALVLTQTTHSRSVAFLSQSLNEGKDNVEIPVVSYCRQAQCMDVDTSVQSEALAQHNLNAMKEFSPFNEYLIGEKAGLFGGNTGTQIYIWNLDKWGSDYTLEWQAGMRGGSSFHQGDIFIRSRRVRTRPGQTSRKVLIDYSLRSYLEVIFLEPRMKIYVQGSLVKSRPLSKSLNSTTLINGEIMGKQVQLTLGRCQIEWDEANSGIFLYWHGRLIEAYKRVGGMIHSADMGRGVIGVIDVTKLMDDGNGGVWVHSNKQAFQDCEPYALLEEWLGKKADEYWDAYFDPVQLKKGNARYKPDNEWVQCDKCRKWRLLTGSSGSKNLPKDWFCYMEPFNGRCESPEVKPDRGVITVGLKRSSGHDPSIPADCEGIQIDESSKLMAEGKGQDKSIQPATDDEEIIAFKRRRRSARTGRKYIQD